MDKYENIVKLEEIRKLVDDNQYIKAIKVLDSMDINRIKSLTDLSIIADVFIQNERYDDATKVLYKMYDKTKARRILYQLVEVSIKRGYIEEAEENLDKYIKAAPSDSYRYIFRYCIDKRKGEPFEILIHSLEQLKEYEYIEKWAYELAKLYHKAGMKDKCIRECSDIVLWFGEGLYVEKAKLLKAYYVGEIDPIHMLKADEKKEAEIKLGLDKTKDYSSIRSQIDQFLAEGEAKIQEVIQDQGREEQRNSIVMEENVKEIIETIKEQDNNIFINNKVDTMPENQSQQEDIPETNTLSEYFIGTGIDYRKILGYFYQKEICKEDIIHSLTDILTDSTKGTHLTISGKTGSGKTTLGKNISKILYEAGWIGSPRIAKINGTKLNQINLLQKGDTLNNCTLIIEEAGTLKNNAVQQLLQLISNLKGHLFVVLEDTTEHIKQLLEAYPNLELVCKSIQLPKYTKEDLFGFANNYIEDNDYLLSEEAITKLVDIINEFEDRRKELSQLSTAMDIIKRAKSAADERNKIELLKVVKSREIETTDFLYIKAEDFI